jgi:hypothetical protein
MVTAHSVIDKNVDLKVACLASINCCASDKKLGRPICLALQPQRLVSVALPGLAAVFGQYISCGIDSQSLIFLDSARISTYL